MKNIVKWVIAFMVVLVFVTCDDGSKPCEHNWQWIETTSATSETEGLETETCLKCGATSGKTQVIPKISETHIHDFGTVWKNNTTQHWHECACGEKTDIDNHIFGNWIPTIEPTTTEEGEETRTCDECGKTETQSVDKLPEQKISKSHSIELKDGALNFEVIYEALPDAAAPEYLTYLEERLESMCNSLNIANVGAVETLISKGNNFTINVEDASNSYEGLLWDYTNKVFKIHNEWISTATGTDLSLTMMRNAFESVVIAMLKSNVYLADKKAFAEHGHAMVSGTSGA